MTIPDKELEPGLPSEALWLSISQRRSGFSESGLLTGAGSCLNHYPRSPQAHIHASCHILQNDAKADWNAGSQEISGQCYLFSAGLSLPNLGLLGTTCLHWDVNFRVRAADPASLSSVSKMLPFKAMIYFHFHSHNANSEVWFLPAPWRDTFWQPMYNPSTPSAFSPSIQ